MPRPWCRGLPAGRSPVPATGIAVFEEQTHQARYIRQSAQLARQIRGEKQAERGLDQGIENEYGELGGAEAPEICPEIDLQGSRHSDGRRADQIAQERHFIGYA